MLWLALTSQIIRMCATCLTYLGSLISMFAFPQGSHYEHLNLNYRLMEEVPPPPPRVFVQWYNLKTLAWSKYDYFSSVSQLGVWIQGKVTICDVRKNMRKQHMNIERKAWTVIHYHVLSLPTGLFISGM